MIVRRRVGMLCAATVTAVVVTASSLTVGGEFASAAVPTDGQTRRVSVSSNATQANDESNHKAVSAHGRFVAFTSHASNLVRKDTNGRQRDVFVRDRGTHVTRRVSVGPHGAQANQACIQPAISAQGRYVAFTSAANNLVRSDTNGTGDVFVRDRVTHVTRRVSVGPHGVQGNDDSSQPQVSANGRYVVFISNASNLIPTDTNGQRDVFIRDRRDHVTRRVSVSSNGDQPDRGSLHPTISADGRYVAFLSAASNLVEADTNGTDDVFVRDRAAKVTRRISVGSSGTEADSFSNGADISASGRYVTFDSSATNLVPDDTNGSQDVFVRDLVLNTTVRVSLTSDGGEADASSGQSSISASGRYVAFASNASNLAAGPDNTADIYLRDRLENSTRRVSVNSRGALANESSLRPAVSADGAHVAFESPASNLAVKDTNHEIDIFVHDVLR